MMSDTAREGVPLAVHLLIRDGGRTLFLRRANTGYADGMLSVPAGHVEPGESALAALAREAKEELGIDIHPDEPAFALVQHKRDADGQERVDLFFTLDRGLREPVNAEPHKCSELLWAESDHPPRDVVPYVRNALERMDDGDPYAQFGW